MFGVRILKGAKNWQIIQQENGFGKLKLNGTYKASPDVSESAVLVRVVMQDSGETVVDWTKAELKAGNWSAMLLVPAGGLYRIETCLNEENQVLEWSRRGDTVLHFGVGDVYVIAGQSNSTGYGRDTITDAPELGVHILRNSGEWDLASHPLGDSTNTIHPINAEQSNPGHSPYLHFGKYLKSVLSYPIGFLQASMGGSPMERWNPDENGDLYRNMLEIIKSSQYPVKGILWYQGCGDTNSLDEADSYYERFMQMVKSLRKDLMCENLPFITVQLNRWLQKAPRGNVDHFWGRVREAQRRAAKNTNIYVVPAIDCRISDFIHTNAASNLTIAERMAKAALHGIYGKACFSLAPNIQKARKIADNKISLIFDNVYERLATYDLPGADSPFTVVDEMGENLVKEFVCNKKNVIELTLERKISKQCVVHGAYQKNPAVFIPYDVKSYLPMLSFYNIPVED